jgi:hypothetical protein
VHVVVGFQNEAPWLYDGGGARLTPLLPLNHANNAGNDPDSCTMYSVPLYLQSSCPHPNLLLVLQVQTFAPPLCTYSNIPGNVHVRLEGDAKPSWIVLFTSLRLQFDLISGHSRHSPLPRLLMGRNGSLFVAELASKRDFPARRLLLHTPWSCGLDPSCRIHQGRLYDH